MREVSSVCLRIARWIPDASQAVWPWLFAEGYLLSVLFMGPPGCGKTTVLRSCALDLSREAGLHVCVVDERNEFFGGRMLEAGHRLDVLCGLDKASAMPIIIRNMAPQAIVADEIGVREDAAAVRDAVRCGAAVLGSAHAASMDDLMGRPMLRQMVEECAFDRYVLLGHRGSVRGIWDEAGKCRMEME